MRTDDLIGRRGMDAKVVAHPSQLSLARGSSGRVDF